MKNNKRVILTSRNSLIKSVFGGVDLWKGILENEKNFLDESINSISTIDDEDSCIQILSVKNNKLNIDLTDCSVFEFPFLIRNKKCSICNIDLDMSELKINEQYKKMYKTTNTQYCKAHNPFNCEICNKLITDEYRYIEDKKYHQKCLNCIYCYKKLGEKICKCDFGFMHKECFAHYNDDIKEKELKYLYKNSPNCEFCDEKIMNEYDIINNYKIHKKCLEKIKDKGIDQGKQYILDGIETKCYICKKVIFGEVLKTVNGLSHKECLSFVMFIIYAFFDIVKNLNRYY